MGIGYEAWLMCDNEDASKTIVAIENLVFGFEFFISGRLSVTLPTQTRSSQTHQGNHAAQGKSLCR